MPPAPPVRSLPAHYHFHTYDFAGSAPFVTGPAQAWRNNWEFYSLRQDLNGLAAYGTGTVPNLAAVPVQVGGATTQGRRTLMLSFGANAPGGPHPTVVITGGIHAREWIAAEVAYLIAEYLIANYMRPPAADPVSNARLVHLRNLVDTRNIRIIPMLNPDGNNTTVFGWYPNDRMWRKNLRALPRWKSTWITELAPLGAVVHPFANVRSSMLAWASYGVLGYDPLNGVPAGVAPGVPAGVLNYQDHQLSNVATGVDLNRNMGTTGWGYDCDGEWDAWGETYFGTRPGGETETANLQVAMNNAALVGAGGNIDVAIDYHCYSRVILYPSERVYSAGGVNQIAPAYQRIGRVLRYLIIDGTGQRYNLGAPGGPGGLIGYDATGTVADRAAQLHQARSFTIELDPGRNDPIGFQLPENQIQTVFETNIRGALAAIEAPATGAADVGVRGTYMGWPVHGAGNRVP